LLTPWFPYRQHQQVSPHPWGSRPR
jgi:hypothetical protein